MNRRFCQKCGKEIIGYPAISRIDNKTEICSECGMKEAFEDFFKMHIEYDDKEVNKNVKMLHNKKW